RHLDDEDVLIEVLHPDVLDPGDQPEHVLRPEVRRIQQRPAQPDQVVDQHEALLSASGRAPVPTIRSTVPKPRETDLPIPAWSGIRKFTRNVPMKPIIATPLSPVGTGRKSRQSAAILPRTQYPNPLASARQFPTIARSSTARRASASADASYL